MKVLIIAVGHPDNVFSLAWHLGEKVDLTVLYVAAGKRSQRGILDLDLSGIKEGYHKDENTIKQIFPKEVIKFVQGKFNLHFLKLPSFKLLNFDNIRQFFQLGLEIRKNKYDVVHYNGASGFFYLLYILTKGRGKQFWTLHDYKSHSGEESKQSEKTNRFFARRNRIQIIQHYEYLRNAVIRDFKLPSTKVHTLYSGPLTIFKSFTSSYHLVPEDDYILFFGRISKYKGVDILIRAYQKIKNPNLQLVIAGKGRINENVRSNNINVHNKYILTEDLIGLIKKASFVVVPYLDATHSAVIATAYEFNKPVIASNVMGLKEVVMDNKTGILIEPSTVHDLKDKMEKLMNTTELIKKLEQNLANELKNGVLSWNNITDKYIELYK